ncbi:MAG: exodeoxyribonuclease VII large subunit [Peptococcaceae bacterium]|nr:exodeoxyribonuclease VII large subunit [Peptococcaceae bacterium]
MQIWSIKDLNNLIGTTLQRQPALRGCWVTGEVSNFKHHMPSGHLYFTLKDGQASLRAVMFRSRAAAVPFVIGNGMKVLAHGDVRIYEKDGSIQLYVDELSPRGVGELSLALEQLKARLAAEGLGDAARKRCLPAYPSCVGIVTSSTGAALHDIVRVARRRNPQVRLVLAPAAVQGGEAPGEIVRALDRIGRWGLCDVIIVGRGGGSLEELWAFNTEEVARAVAACPVPVISAVGHEIDFTIADFVADLRAPTPSAAAELAIPSAEEMAGILAGVENRMKKALEGVFGRKRYQLDLLGQRPELRDPRRSLDMRIQKLGVMEERLRSAKTGLMTKKDDILHLFGSRLHALSPLAVLSRGYGVVQDDRGQVVCSVQDVNPGDHVGIRLTDGSLECEVETAIRDT